MVTKGCTTIHIIDTLQEECFHISPNSFVTLLLFSYQNDYIGDGIILHLPKAQQQYALYLKMASTPKSKPLNKSYCGRVELNQNLTFRVV